MFSHFGGFWVLFSDSSVFFTSIALFFVPKDPLGSDNKHEQIFKKLENLSKTRSVFWKTIVIMISHTLSVIRRAYQAETHLIRTGVIVGLIVVGDQVYM